MADFDALTYYRLIGRYNGIVADSVGPFGDPGEVPDLYTVNMAATIRLGVARGSSLRQPPELRLTGATPPRTLLLLPIRANVESGVLRLPGIEGDVPDGVLLVAKSPILGLAADEKLIATVTFGEVTIGGSTFQFDPVSYVVPEVLPAAYTAGRTQVITLTAATGGTWAPTYGGSAGAMLAPGATNAQVQTSLRGIPHPDTTAATVAGNAGGPYTVTFPAGIARPLPIGAVDTLTPQAAAIRVDDQYQHVVVDLTTVARWTPAA